MIKKLTPHGNSLALIIDRSIMELLHIEKSTPLNISTDGSALIVTPVRSLKRKKLFEAALNETFVRYGSMYKRLA